ncbi:hypothetical protein GCM10009799_26780 [Nocardiopsis rhodophaea]|uniref:Uncharacterized protein n=1 Tax=Nocardiopsis rhodophaea TaxID=280238 RepID=A0ABN2T5L6_9ACTN
MPPPPPAVAAVFHPRAPEDIQADKAAQQTLAAISHAPGQRRTQAPAARIRRSDLVLGALFPCCGGGGYNCVTRTSVISGPQVGGRGVEANWSWPKSLGEGNATGGSPPSPPERNGHA